MGRSPRVPNFLAEHSHGETRVCELVMVKTETSRGGTPCLLNGGDRKQKALN
jgi:hypothetical protein